MAALTSQVALVTGAGSGLGHAIVRRFLEEGARVGVLEISPAKAHALAEEFGEDVVVTAGDASVYQDNQSAVQKTVAGFGSLDCFIANAGLWDFAAGLDDLPTDAISTAFDQLFSVNVKAGLLGAKAAYPHLRMSQGSMIFTLSNAAFYPGGGGPLYTASKHALVGVVRQLAYELAPDVRVNGVAPAGMGTDLRGPSALGQSNTAYGPRDADREMKLWSPLKLAPRPEDYTGHYVLLASRRDAAVVTGAIHVCDTGGAVRRDQDPVEDK